MAKAVQRLQWDYVSLIWATLANANRDPQKHPKPFSPADVHPLRDAQEFEDDSAREPDWSTINKIRSQYKVTSLNGSRVQNHQGGGSVPGANGSG